MEKIPRRPWASQLLPLIAILQVPLSSAYPFVNLPYQNTTTSTNPNVPQGPSARPIENGHPLPDVEATWSKAFTPNMPTPSASHDWPATVPDIPYETADEQVWVAYTTLTEEATLTSGADTIVSTTVVTSFSSTPAPRWWSSSHPPWTSGTWPFPTWNEPSSTATVSMPSTSTGTPVPTSSSSMVSVTSSTSSSSSSSPSASLPSGSATTSASIGSSTSSSTIVPASSSITSASSQTSTTASSPSSVEETSTTTEVISETSTTTTTTSVPNSSLTSLTTSAVQSATISITQSTSGTAHTSLETSGQPTSVPFPTTVTSATTTISLVNTSTLGSVGPTATGNVTGISASNIFQPIETDSPPPQVTPKGDHPVVPLGIQQQSSRYETNKFYANFFLGTQNEGTWTHPFSVSWSSGGGETNSWGLAVSHTERFQLANGTRNASVDAGDVSYFVNPVGIQSLVLSAAELGGSTVLTTDSLQSFSVNVNLAVSSGSSPLLTFPLLQGMAFVTGVYNGGTPLIQSGVGITNVTYGGSVINSTTYKYRALLQNGYTWLIYITPSNAGYSQNSFTLLNAGTLQGPSGFNGYIQVTKVPPNTPDAESVYDQSAGVYPVAANITASVEGTSGTYTISWTKQGVTDRTLLMYALPHHVQTFSNSTSAGLTDLQLVTTTKGYATATRGDSWTLEEPDLPLSMGFAPWTPEPGNVNAALSKQVVQAINSAGTSELSQNISQQTNTGSLYYDGKALAKFAAICYTVNDIAGNATLAQSGLQLLKAAYDFHVNNEMEYPLVYDTVWGGAVSDCSYVGGGDGCDFGNTYYNDHHFHYGYFVYAAAVIAYLDPAWLNQGTNKAWVNMLVRDYANSISDDPYFPFQRMFDWYHGHSWAHGLFETADGKDQESSSEDTMASYGMKMWGQIIGDTNMEARGNLMLAVQARSLGDYYLYDDDNTVEPANFIGNKAAGILFENKIDHTTYFGNVAAYIEGIHMLPVMPFSPLIRTTTFVQQEWDAYFASSGISPVDDVTGGWRGILMANYAIVDPVSSYEFFSDPNFDMSYLDGGASRTWYLAFSAALGGSGGSGSND